MNTQIVSLLLRKTKPGFEEMSQILELIREDIKPDLARFTLKPFSQLACMDENNGFYRSMSDDGPADTTQEFNEINLNTQGITYFSDDNERVKVLCHTRMMYAWGLSRSAKWVVLEITVVLTSKTVNGCYLERAKSVKVVETTLEDMLKRANVSHLGVLMIILQEFTLCTGRAKRNYEYAQETERGLKNIFDMLTRVVIQ